MPSVPMPIFHPTTVVAPRVAPRERVHPVHPIRMGTGVGGSGWRVESLPPIMIGKGQESGSMCSLYEVVMPPKVAVVDSRDSR